MSRGKVSCALALASLLLCGCVVEQPQNAPAQGVSAGGVDNRAGVRTSPSPEAQPGAENSASTESRANAESQPSPEGQTGAEGRPSPEGGAGSFAGAGGKLETYARAAAADLAPEQTAALGRIRDEARRLLALRGYLRSGRDAASRWAWSRERIEAYEKSAEYASALAEIGKVRSAFEAANPGFTLRVNTKVRSLDEQLSKWDENDSVARAGEELLARAREELAAQSYGDAAAAEDVQRFERFLRGVTTRATPTLAVPGLSPHGQSRAFDFQVMRGSQLIAGPSSPGAWDAAGWTDKVREAVTRASTKFKGPLASPREPWHYDYSP